MPGDHATLRRVGEPRVGGAGLYIAEAVLDELVYAALYSPETVQTALLLGGVFRGAAGVYVEVRGYAELGAYSDLTSFVRESNAAWAMTMNRLGRNNAELRVVGWVGLLPQGESLPQTDVQLVHRSLFNLPYHVALLMDPVQRTCAAYGVDDAGSMTCVGFNVVERGAPTVEQSQQTPRKTTGSRHDDQDQVHEADESEVSAQTEPDDAADGTVQVPTDGSDGGGIEASIQSKD